MKNEESEAKPRSNRGDMLLFSLVWCSAFVFVLVVLGHQEWCTEGLDGAVKCSSIFQAFWSLELNEMGDALAGFFGSFAFLAAVLALIMQSRELAAQRSELQLTRQEYERNREATEKIAANAASQFQEMQKNRKDQTADRAKRDNLEALEEVMQGLAIYVKATCDNIQRVASSGATEPLPMRTAESRSATYRKNYGDVEIPQQDDWFYEMNASVEFFHYADDFLDYCKNELQRMTLEDLRKTKNAVILLQNAIERGISARKMLNRVRELEHDLPLAGRTKVEIRDLSKLEQVLFDVDEVARRKAKLL